MRVLRWSVEALTGALLALALGAGPAAGAPAGCTLRLTGLAPAFPAGGGTDTFTAAIANHGAAAYRSVRRAYVIELAGLRPQQMRLERRAGGSGYRPLRVRALADGAWADDDADAGPLNPSGSRSYTLRLTFLRGAPYGALTVRMLAYGQVDGAWVLLGDSAAYRSRVGPASPPARPELDRPGSAAIASSPGVGDPAVIAGSAGAADRAGSAGSAGSADTADPGSAAGATATRRAAPPLATAGLLALGAGIVAVPTLGWRLRRRFQAILRG
jgi:hypothetical protein